MLSDGPSPRPGFWGRLARLWRPAPPPPPAAFDPLFPARPLSAHRAPAPERPVMPPPEALAPETLRPEERAALEEIGRLLASGDAEAAAALLETVFAQRAEARDAAGHPVYLKTRLRVALATGPRAAAEQLAAELRAAVAQGDPIADTLVARHLETDNEAATARPYWQKVAAQWPLDGEARAALARWSAGAPPLPAGAAPPPVEQLPDLAVLARKVEALDLSAAALQRMAVAPPAQPSLRQRLVPGTEPFAPVWIPQWHGVQVSLPARPLNCYVVPDLIVSGMGGISGQCWVDGKLCVGAELMPVYLHGMCQLAGGGAPLLRTSHTLPLRTIAAPSTVLTGQGVRVYGHFVIEMLIRILTVRRALGAQEAACRYLLDRDAPRWLLRMLADLGIAPDRIDFYRMNAERIRLRHAVLAGYAFQEDGFHPFAGDLIDEFLAALPPAEPMADAARVFVLRPAEQNPNAPRRECRNQVELAAIAAERHGFVALSPEKLSWRQQIALFQQAEIVLGLAGSGMHNTLFSGAATAVAQLGVMSLAQSQIGSLRAQRNAYLSVDYSTLTAQNDYRYDIDPVQFTAFLDAVVAGAAPPVTPT